MSEIVHLTTSIFHTYYRKVGDIQVTEKATKTSTRKIKSKQKIEEKVFLEYRDQVDVTNIMETAKNEFKKLYPDEAIENIYVYMNAIEMTAYYVVNGRTEETFKFKLI